MCLLCGVVGFGKGFSDDEFGHVDFVLKEIGDGVFDVAGDVSWNFTIQEEKLTLERLAHLDLSGSSSTPSQSRFAPTDNCLFEPFRYL